MPSTAPAAATGLPATITDAIDRSIGRRGFLSGLAALPLIGGSVALIGQPRAVAEPVSRELLEAYKTWLHYEHRCLAWEMAELPENVAYYGGRRSDRYKLIERMICHVGTGDASSFHRYDGTSPASARAALVLSAVGCDWKEGD